MKYQFRIIIAIFTEVIVLGIFSSAHAATLSLTPVSSEIGIGEKMITELRIDSEGVSFNAAQAVIRFPKDTLEVLILDKTESAFNFWIEEPQFFNTEGIISFTGGTPYGISGGAVGILKIEFQAKGAGSGTLSITEAAIAAADGSGTNILSKINDAVITVVPQRTMPKTPEVQQKIPEPQEIVRKPISSELLPLKPVLKVPFYPEENRWYNLVTQFTASWDLPLDISGVSTALDKHPSSIPPEQSEGLFDNKTFASLSDGIWYIHIRFKNNLGWGPTTHYRLAIDTQPPIGFGIDILEGEKTDNPTPTLQFKTFDARSGLKDYQIRIGEGDFIQITPEDFTGSIKLPLQAPGQRRILVRATDKSENSIENSVDIEIIPIVSPIITYVPKELFPEDERTLIIKGTASPNISILVKAQKSLSKRRGEIIAQGTTNADDKGNWEFSFDQPLRNGRYILTAQSQDERGALSLVVESPEVRVKSKPIIRIGKFQLGMGGALILLIVIIVAGFSGGAWFYKKRQGKLALRLLIVKTDMAKVFKIIQSDVEKLQRTTETITKSDDEFIIKRLRENIKKMERYLRKEMERLK